MSIPANNASMKRYFPIPLLVFIVFSTSTALAHNLYVLVTPDGQGPSVVDVIFEHSPVPGKGTYNSPLIERGKTWVETKSGDEMPLPELHEISRLGKKFLRTETQAQGPRAIIHSCDWGVYKRRLCYFHGKFLDVEDSKQLKTLARTESLPLDLVPMKGDGGALVVQVLFEGSPVSDGKLWTWSPDGKESKLTLDAEGRAMIEATHEGTYSFAYVHKLEGLKGTFNGEKYDDGVTHGTTVNLKWPLEK